jgi:hypothetical protein
LKGMYQNAERKTPVFRERRRKVEVKVREREEENKKKPDA